LREFLLQYILPPQQSVKAHAESVGYSDDLDIGHEAFAALDALDGVFVYIKAGKLDHIGELPLRESHIFAQKGYILSANIIQPVFCFVDEHKTVSETFSAYLILYSLAANMSIVVI
jgi:hypothetical protein